ncbi:actin [Anaeramoeba flamelloides]|uniref:Actin n=1 Tax=Anaeramoeba flamelloides TaxID=1746091 RepID=A0ABQ8XVG9_9EUKA|nr:actin [Anaeramoeba flamelloides]
MTTNKFAVFDLGTLHGRLGFSDCKLPTHSFRTLVAHSNEEKAKVSKLVPPKDLFIGTEYLEYAECVDVIKPIYDAKVQSWGDWEHMLDYSFLTLFSSLTDLDTPLVYVEGPTWDVSMKRKAGEIIFEKYQLPSLGLVNHAEMSSFASNNFQIGNSLVVELGGTCSYCVPVIEGQALVSQATVMEAGGTTVTQAMIRGIQEEGVDFGTKDLTRIKEIVIKFKKMEGYICQGVEKEIELNKKVKFEIPNGDGKYISVGNTRFLAPELLFSPRVKNKQSFSNGMHNLAWDCLKKLKKEIFAKASSQIIIAGGLSGYRGVKQRFLQEFNKIAKESNFSISENEIIVPQNGVTLAWRGAAKFTHHELFEKQLVTKEQFDNLGENAFN